MSLVLWVFGATAELPENHTSVHSLVLGAVFLQLTGSSDVIPRGGLPLRQNSEPHSLSLIEKQEELERGAREFSRGGGVICFWMHVKLIHSHH